VDETQMTLAMDWAGRGVPTDIPLGWLGSEKLFGCRAYWDGKELWTRKGKTIQVPNFWKAKLPTDIHLDGEIYAGRKNFMAAYAATEYGKFSPEVKFIAFDCPSVKGNWLERMNAAKAKTNNLEFSGAVDSFVLPTKAFEWGTEVGRMSRSGAEGLIMRNPETKIYEVGRSQNY
jgi:DNA ligase-1